MILEKPKQAIFWSEGSNLYYLAKRDDGGDNGSFSIIID